MKTVRLGDCLTKVETWNPARTGADVKFSYIDICSVNQQSKQIENAELVACSKAPSRARQLVKVDDVLVSSVRPNLNAVAKVLDDTNKATASTGFCVLRANTNVIDPNYLFNWVKNELFVSDMVKKATGASYPAVSDKIIFNSSIPLPPLAQQQRIAAILDKAAEIKAKREQAIAKLDELAIAIFEEAVSRSQTIEALGELCDVRDGTHDSPKYVAEGFPLITSRNIVDGKIDASTANYINEEDYMEICKRSRVDHGDILMPMIGTIGNPVIVKELTPKFAIKNVALIKFKSNSPSNIYINAFLKSRHFYKYVNKLSRGGTQKFLGLGDIRKLPIPMLAKESEVEFCTRLQRTNMLREQTILKLAKVNSLVASLQHQAFTTGFNA